MDIKSKTDIEYKLANLIEEVTFSRIKSDQAKPDQGILTDLGLDSLDYASAMLGCENWLGIKIDEKSIDWKEVQTVGQLAQVLFESQSLDKKACKNSRET